MTDGAEVIQDYRHAGLSPRAHPVAFPREPRPAPRRHLRRGDGGARRRSLTTASIVLVRQMPGSAQGVLFVTVEDATGVANLMIRRKLYERQRRVVLGARMLGVKGRVQREGRVVHLIAHRLIDLSTDLAGIGSSEQGFPSPRGRGDEAHRDGFGRDPRDMRDPRGRIDQLRIRPRNFR